MSERESTLTIEEAAMRLGVSIATARRMAAAGRIPARKSGKQWVVDGTRLSRLPARRRIAAKPIVDLDQALRYVKTTDLVELLLPDVLRHEDILADEAGVLAAARARLEGVPPGAAMEAEVDKTSFFTRWIVLLDVEDRIAYQAAVAALASKIDAATPDCVFSARLAQDRRYFLKRGPSQWVAWRRYVLGQLQAGSEWMVKTDLTAYFDTIPHRMLMAEVAALNPDPRVLAALGEMLRTWAVVPGQGLPQGPNASRVLGNLYMLPVDRAMLAAGWQYSRFLDDVRIVTRTKAEAHEATRQFQNECRSLGLIISSSKTQLLHGDDARKELEPNTQFAAADYFMTANALNFARRELKKILRDALKSKVQINERNARFSLWRLAQLREVGTLGQVLRRLEDLASIASIVAPYLRPFIMRPRVVDGLASFLADGARSHSTYLATWLFAAMLEHPGQLPAAWADQAAVRVKNKNQPAHLRAVAAVVMARGARAADAVWIKNDIDREHDPVVLRGYAVGLHWIGELEKGTQRRLTARSPRLAATVDYLQGRTVLPSLVYAKQKLRLA